MEFIILLTKIEKKFSMLLGIQVLSLIIKTIHKGYYKVIVIKLLVQLIIEIKETQDKKII